MTRAYKVEAKDGDEVLAKRYGTTQADARTKRDELAATFSLKKSDVEITEVEIPYGKAELIGFINELAAEADAVQE